MGVISLQGESQAKLIERKILDTLDPEVIEKRRLICGDAYAFQGDERRIIFLSMVAAPGETRIGALTTESARQGFNVAVSRAQDQLWLFHTANLDVLSDACMRHRLLSYMLNPGRQAGEERGQRFDSNFERDVFRRITDKGFHVRTQVCVGDPTNHRYRIDLVVDGMQGRLAVECDGDHWHGPERHEHDMARQRDLERAGWQFARIGGGDFYRDQVEAMKPVWAELDRLGIQPSGVDEAAAQPPAPADRVHMSETATVESEVSEPPTATTNPEPVVCSPGETEETVEIHPDAAPVASGSSVDAPEQEMPRASEPGSPWLFPASTSATNESRGRASYVSFEGTTGDDPRNVNAMQVAEGLCRIIDVEGPMLAKRAYDVYLRGCGIHRMGGELKRSMNKALQLAIRRGKVVKENESGGSELADSIVRSTGIPPVLVRVRGPRDFSEIPPSELQLVARRVLADGSIELGSDAHLRAVLDFFDLKRLTVQVGTTLLDVLDRRYPYVDEILERDAK